MRTIKSIAILITATGLVGCQSAYHVRSYKAPAKVLSREAGVFIAVPPDAEDEKGSGLLAAKTLQSAFSNYASQVQLSEGPASLNTHLTNAAAAKSTYLLEPTINKWEEEPTEWTGKSDALDMKLRLLQVPNGTVVSETDFDAKSKWMTLGGGRVEHLLQPLAAEWVRTLYEGGEFKAPDPKAKGRPIEKK